MDLKYIALSTLTPQESLIFSHQLVAHTIAPFDILMAPRINVILQHIDLLARAIESSRKREFAGLLAFTDGQRENGWMSFKHAVLSAMYSNDEQVSTAGEQLQEILMQYHSESGQLGYIEQTKVLHRLKEKLDGMPELLSAASVGSQYEDMVAAMHAFDQVFEEKTKVEEMIQSNYTVDKSISELCKQVNALLKDVQLLIESGEEGIEKLVQAYNTVIKEASESDAFDQKILKNVMASLVNLL